MSLNKSISFKISLALKIYSKFVMMNYNRIFCLSMSFISFGSKKKALRNNPSIIHLIKIGLLTKLFDYKILVKFYYPTLLEINVFIKLFYSINVYCLFNELIYF